MSAGDADPRDPRIVAQLLLLAAYVALVLYAGATGDPLAQVAVDVAFAVAAVAFGLYLASAAGGETLHMLAAGAFVGAGLAQAGALFDIGGAEPLSNLFLLLALVLFVVVRVRG